MDGTESFQSLGCCFIAQSIFVPPELSAVFLEVYDAFCSLMLSSKSFIWMASAAS